MQDSPSRGTSKRSVEPGTPLSVQSVSAPPCPVAASRPEFPSPSQLPWLQLSGSQVSMPSLRALQACAGDGCSRPVSAQCGERPHSASSAGLPPLPGAVHDMHRAPTTLRDLARSTHGVRRGGIDSSWRSRNRDAVSHKSHLHGQRLTRSLSETALAEIGSRTSSKMQQDEVSCHDSNLPFPRKRSRLKRILARLWRFGRS